MSEEKLNQLEAQLTDFRKDVDQKFDILNIKIDSWERSLDAYQKASEASQQASQHVVNLAFTLIITAVIAIIVPALISR
jgi:hypothetical protein